MSRNSKGRASQRKHNPMIHPRKMMMKRNRGFRMADGLTKSTIGSLKHLRYMERIGTWCISM
jgi:hypothetical protein